MDLNTQKILLITVMVIAFAAIAVLLGIIIYYEFLRKVAVIKEQIWSNKEELDSHNIVKLVKRDDEKFKILLLTDTQLRKNNDTALHCYNVIKKLVTITKPDLIVTLGDNVEGVLNYKINQELTNFLDSFGIPWATVFGNHDAEGLADRTYLGNQYIKAKNSLFAFGPSNIKGFGNYVINIVEKNTDGNERIIYSLNFIDSNRYRRGNKIVSYDCIGADQLEYFKWYNKQLKTIFNDDDMPSMGFFHIAPMEVADYYNKLKASQNDKSVTVPPEDEFGEFREAPCPSNVNTGVVDVAKSIGMDYLFIGHDHINNASFTVANGVRITYGLKTGRGCYSNDDLDGGTIITIDSNRLVTIEHVNLGLNTDN